MGGDINDLKPNYRPRTSWLIDEHGDSRILPAVESARPRARTHGVKDVKLTEIRVHTAQTVLLSYQRNHYHKLLAQFYPQLCSQN